MINITINTPASQPLLSAPVNTGAKGYYSLMQHDYITLPFSLQSPVEFGIGSYADLRNVFTDPQGGKLAKIYKVCDLQAPTYNTATGGYDYELRLDAYYWLWKNKIFRYTPEAAGQEASWSLTASLNVHLGVFLRNLDALGETYGEKDYEFSIDSTVENKAVAITYDNTNLIDALSRMAEAWGCEWWVTENVIHFGRLENGDAVELEIGVQAEDMTRNESKGTYATRIYAFGSTRNIPENYRPNDNEDLTVNGVVQKRLMLPDGTPYIDARPGLTEQEVVESVVVFDDIYPRRVGTLSDVKTVDRAIEDEEGNQTGTFKAYQYRDTGLAFEEYYTLEGQELRIVFQSGKLNGLDFGVIFNPNDSDPAEQLWEIVANEDYGRRLPDEVIKPENGDTYILYGFDIQLVSDQYIPAAEQELKDKAEEYVAKTQVDDGAYTVPLYSSWVEADEVNRTFDAGQRIKLKNPAFFGTSGRTSRVIGWEMCLDIPYDRPVYTIGESAQYSRLGELEDKVDALTLNGQAYYGLGGGSGVYLIKTNDSTPASNSNAYSALRSRLEFLLKTKEETMPFLLRFGEFIDSMAAGAGAGIFPDGRGQFEKIEVRSALVVLELIYNRIQAMEGDYSFSTSGTIETVTQEADGTYTLKMRRRWEHDFTAFREHDIIYGIVNDLASDSGEYYASWLRVLSVNTVANTLSATLYPDTEVPGGVNHAPEPLMVVTQRGNPVDETRQGWWYLSAAERCLCMLEGVTKPVLEEDNYYVIIGRLKHLSLFDNLPVNYLHSYVFCRGIIANDIQRVDFQGTLPRVANNRGAWSLSVAQGEEPYNAGRQADTGTGLVEMYDTVWHYGCEWMCISTGTTDEPKYGAQGWAMVQGNPAFSIDINSSNDWYFDADKFNTTLSVVGTLYNQDVTASILDADVSWTRDTGNVTEDNAWAVAHAGAGKSITLTVDDLGPDYLTLTGCKFIAKAVLRDGQKELEAHDFWSF